MANIALITNNILSDSGTALTSVLSGSGTTNYLSKFTGSTALGNSIIYDNGTAVGIGTTSPSAKLEVYNGAFRISDSSGSQLTINSNGGSGGSAYIEAYNNSSLQFKDLLFYGKDIIFRAQVSTEAERMRITSSGNVLIGTSTDAGFKLDVNGTGRVSGNATNGAPFFSLNATSANNTFNWVSTAFASNLASGNNLIHFIGQSGSTKNAAYLGFKYSGSGSNDNILTLGLYGVDNVLNINGSGNVGIGTTSPTLKLEVDNTTTGEQCSLGIVADSVANVTDLSSKWYYTVNNSIKFHRGGNSTGGEISIWTTPEGGSLTERIRVNSSGNVGIGTSTPSDKLHISGNLRVTGTIIDSNNSPGTSGQVLSSTATGTDWVSLSEITGVDGTGTTNYVSKWLDANTIGNSQLFDNGTNVGIGTSSPNLYPFGGKLNVAGNISINGTKIGFAVTDAFTLNGIDTAHYGMSSNLDLTQLSGYGGLVFATSGSERMRITSGGNVLIGTSTDAGFKLDVNGTSIVRTGTYGLGASPLTLVQTSGDTRNASLFLGDPSVYNQPGAYDTCTVNGTISGIRLGFYSDNWMMSATRSGGPDIYGLVLSRNGSEKLVINNSGNVGIGTTSPAQKLQVVDGYISTKDNSSYGGAFMEGANGIAYFGSLGNDVISLYSGGAIKLQIKANGNTLIGTTTDAGYKLDVNGTGRFKSSGQILTLETTTARGSGSNYLSFTDPTGSKGYIGYGSGSTDDFIISNALSANMLFYVNGSQRLSLASTGAATFSSLSGSGTRMVIADSSGTLSTQAVPTGTVTGSGTTNYLSKWTSSSALGNSIMSESGTILTVAGSGRFTGFDSGYYNENVIAIGNGTYNPKIGMGSTSGYRWNARINDIGGNGEYIIRYEEGSLDALTINRSGNLGLGVTPSAWSLGKAFEINSAGNSIWSYSNDNIYLNQNSFFNGSWKYGTSATAAQYVLFQGQHLWQTAPSGTAGNAISFTQAMTLATSGNLLIGTTTDGGYKLDVNGLGRFGNSYNAIIGNDGTYVGYAAIGFGGNTNGYNRVFGSVTTSDGLYLASATGHGIHFRANGGTTNNMYIAPSGNVGIGTTSPLVALDVRGTVIITNQAGGNYNENLRLPESTSGYASLTLGGSIAASGTSAAQWTLVKFPTTNNFSIRNNNSDYVTVFPTGNFAIGNSTDAGYKLDVVNGAIRIVYSTFAGIEYHNTAGTWEGYVGTENGAGNLRYNSRQGAHTWYANSAAKMILTAAGNVGIGTTSPYSKLEIVGAATSWNDSPAITLTDNVYNVDSRRWIIGNIATNYGSFNIASSTTPTGNPTTPRFTITKDGFVGIGTSSPSHKLDVDGNIRIRSNSGIYYDTTGANASNYIGITNDYWTTLTCGRGYSSSINLTNSNGILFNANYTEAMRIEVSNNVLIGTTTDAGQKLQVNGSGNFNLGNSGYIKLQSGSGQRHGFIQSAYSNFLFSNNIYYDGSNWRYDQNGYGAQIQTETLSVGVIAFNTFASGTAGGVATIIESMRIVNNGNILMGTTSDSGHKLQVNGTSKFTNSIYLTGTNRFIASGSSSQSVALYGGSAYSDGAYFNVTGNTYGASPGGGSAEFVIRTNSDSKFAMFGYNGSSWARYMTLFGPTGNMNIGYGTLDNGFKFTVQGDAYVEGNAYIMGTVTGVTALTTNNYVYANANESGGGIFVYADITSGPNNLYSGGQIKANIYSSSLLTPTTVVPSTSQVLMSWYPTTTQGVFIDYTLWIDGPNAMRSGTIMVVNDTSGNVQYTDTATIDLNASTSGVTLAAANNGGTMEVTLYNGTGNVAYINIITRYIPTMS